MKVMKRLKFAFDGAEADEAIAVAQCWGKVVTTGRKSFLPRAITK